MVCICFGRDYLIPALSQHISRDVFLRNNARFTQNAAVHQDRHVRAHLLERILAVARVVDRRWKRLPALIRLAFTTGLRRGNLQGGKVITVPLREPGAALLRR